MRTDVAVVGLGHAGTEAALACARMGLSVVAITLRLDRAAMLSCNPAIGGTAKGHLVHELDALGGEMGRVADLTGTHFKVLNRSRGPSVQATRVLCDREAYARTMQGVLASQPGLELLEAEVCGLEVLGGRVVGVRLSDGREVSARAVVVTTGTFLRALMHVGERQEVGGRAGDAAAVGLSAQLAALGFRLGRFKTGTPPRLLAGSIDFGRCEAQPGDEVPRPFSSRSMREVEAQLAFPRQARVECHLTHTNERTHRAVRAGLERSPLFCGAIEGRGPRYCPSLEDKVVRFASRERHQVFLEPEGARSALVYPAGLSTSLPADVQQEVLRTIRGLEEVEIARHGYAVEYDFADPTQLKATLETRRLGGLYFAGQLNGTSGYEEASFQGLLAGINAGLSLRGEAPLVLGRAEAHGGVLVDELVARGVDEPFRMLTSRSEHRLRLREGNADLRLRPHAERVGLASAGDLAWTAWRRGCIAAEVGRLRATGGAVLLRRPEESWHSVTAADPRRPELASHVVSEVEVELKYEGYIAQQERALSRVQRPPATVEIPVGFEFNGINGLSGEARDRLALARPRTLGEMRGLPGMTPAAISLVWIHLERWSRARDAQGPVDKVCGTLVPPVKVGKSCG